MSGDSRTMRSNKRLRDEGSGSGDFIDGPKEMKGIEKYLKMSVKQLQQEAAARGVSAIGLKKELAERLCGADSSNPIGLDGMFLISLIFNLACVSAREIGREWERERDIGERVRERLGEGER